MSFRLTRYSVALVRDSSVMKDGAKRLGSLTDIIAIMEDMRLLDREQLRVYFLDCRHGLIGWEVVSQGTINASLAHPREVFKGAILSNAAAIIIAHNHPSGDPSPSDEDVRLTKRIKEAGHIMGIELLDHVIVGEQGSYSFTTAGAL